MQAEIIHGNMKVHHSLESFEKPEFSVVTSGTFDGVHIGHQRILSRIQEISRKHSGETIVITFWPHPRIVLSKGHTDMKLLSTIDEKIDLLDRQGIDHLLILPFTDEFSQLSPEEFIQRIYVDGLGTKKLVIGYDHRFGKNREGGLDYLQANKERYHFTVEEIPRQDIEEVGVSSTKIRNALLEGHVHLANQYLGYAYSFRGKVIHGDKLGRDIGFPTANIEVPEAYKLIPDDGIYAVKTKVLGQVFDGMLYLGKRPTLNGQAENHRIEVNLFDFDSDIYDENIEVSLIERIRGDEKFDSIEEMRLQLEKDGVKAKELLS